MTHHLADTCAALVLCFMGFSAMHAVLDGDGPPEWSRRVFDFCCGLLVWWLAFSLMHFTP